jgi:hypothetical protein
MKPSRNKWADHGERDSDTFDRKARKNRKRKSHHDDDSADERYNRVGSWYDADPDQLGYLDADPK